MYCKLSVFIIILISVIVFIILLYDEYPLQHKAQHNIRYQEKFLNKLNPYGESDGKMSFNYLVNPSYTNNILITYYFNDDNPGVYHPLQIPTIVKSKKYYGNTGKKAGVFSEFIFIYELFFKQIYDNLYNSQGIRI